ncbi:Glyoxalase/Bleomycin resistance protein/Dioxygenase superfamily protein [Catalinimonas alkaloidigena]|uniref:Glyoxalase/Bleomycin resistance protein/Dioxygenase superfamily protein n=1 Tax=Catalinimonas alkaloidigena TaxID=1075417 RepID=A0A1G9LPV2_9BACT|nr:VOC family protein [Catalinimonas alkaloidigena]SDL63515.1 Glyoxalase/Bleomycin resistance protein/Dioxygenase superfamily protein [Catalinimonas alkaloidigena]
MQILKIKETCLYVKNLDATEAFYHGKLGFPVINRTDDSHIFFRVGASVLLCFVAEKSRQQQSPPPHGGEGALHLAFEVVPEVYDDTRRHVQSLGIPIVEDSVWKNGKRSFYFHDPEGHVLEIIEEGTWEQG